MGRIEFIDRQRENWLASLRGVAALLVFVSHLPLYDACPDLGFILGRIGVVCFFLMTGYLALKARGNRSGKQYLLNRFFRLYPVFWLLLLITFFELGTDKISVKVLLANATLFEEFINQPKIIGPSWMLPMQVVFFLTLVVKGGEFFVNGKMRGWNESRGIALMCGIMLLSMFTGAARYKTNIPFPTAFFLLQGVAYFGVYYREMINDVISLKCLCKMFAIFEFGMIIASRLSYDNALSYFIAYNIGFILFLLFHKININHLLSIQLGKIGFTFFLGAEIPYYLLSESFISDEYGLLFKCFIKFLGAIIFAYLITKYVELPLLEYGKKIEKNIL